MDTVFFIITFVVIALPLLFACIITYYREKPCDGRTQQKQTPKTDDAEAEEQINSDAPKERKAPVLEIVACCLLGAFILGQIGNTLELTGGRFDARLVAYTIGVLSLAIAALVLMIIDTVKRMR